MTSSLTAAPPVARPRYLSLPAGASSAAEDVIGLADSVELALDEAQQLVLQGALTERSNGMWAANQVGLIEPRQNGKTHTLAADALGSLYVLKLPLVMWTAHRFSTAIEAWRLMRDIVTNWDHLRRRVQGVRRTTWGGGEIELRGGCRVLFGSRSAGASGRGFSLEKLYLDEAFDLTDDDLAALLPALSARPNHQVWYASSAPKPHSEVLRRVCKAGRRGAPGMAYFEWCASLDADSGDRAAWADANPAYPHRITEETIAGELATMSDEDFRRERLGIWSEDQSAGVLPGWGRLFVDQPPPPPTAIGLSVAIDGAWGSIASADLWDDERINLSAVDRRPGTAWLVGEAKRIQIERACAVVVDEKCPDGTLIAALENAGVDVTVMKLADLVAACSELVNRVREGTVTHQRTTELDAAIDVADWRDVGDGRRVFGRRRSSGPVDMLEAAVAAMWGALNGSTMPAIYGPELVTAGVSGTDRAAEQAAARRRRLEAR